MPMVVKAWVRKGAITASGKLNLYAVDPHINAADDVRLLQAKHLKERRQCFYAMPSGRTIPGFTSWGKHGSLFRTKTYVLWSGQVSGQISLALKLSGWPAVCMVVADSVALWSI